MGRLLGWGVDAVLNICGAFHGEELGGGRGAPETHRNSAFSCMLGPVDTAQTRIG